MSDEELVKRLLDFDKVTVGDARDAALRIEALTAKVKLMDDLDVINGEKIEALTEQLEAARADAKEAEAYAEELEAKNGNLCDLAVNEHGRAERAEAKLSKAVKALLLARVHVANNEQGWSVGRASARSDLKIIDATLAGIEGSNAP
jgi:BMFP domain-containing protein YqiC